MIKRKVNKKGVLGLEFLMPAIIILGVAAIGLAVRLVILGNIQTQVYTGTGVIDEQLNLFTNNFTALGNSRITTDSTATFENSTSAESVNVDWDITGTFAGTSVRLSSGQNAALNGSPINASYTYGADSLASTAIGTSVTSLDDFVTWYALFVLIIAALIILGMVFLIAKGGIVGR